MEYTVLEIAKRLERTEGDGGVSSEAARKRLDRYGFKPVRYVGVNAIFELSDDDIEFLKQLYKRGHGTKPSSNNIVNGLTVKEIAEKLKVPFETVEAQINNEEIKPIGKINVYAPSIIARLEEAMSGKKT